MPKHQQSFPLNNIDMDIVLAFCYEAMKELQWNAVFAGEIGLQGNTPDKWGKKGQSITCTVDNGTLTVTSEMVNDEMFDITGKNKKNVTAFIKAFETAKANLDAAVVEQNKQAIADLRKSTLVAVQEHEQQVAELDAAMNLSTGKIFATYVIMGINVLVFILMVIDGAGLFGDNSLVHIKWGSNFAPLTLSGDWWRLFTCTFIHFGIIHLGMNMYCFYSIGIYLEPMLGKIRYIAGYVCTGVLASLVSLWWHKEPVNSAGASGAVFGVYGLFLALLTTSLIPKTARQSMLQSIGLFIVYNLVYGIKSGVDNAAHIGGLVSGFAIGGIYAYDIKKEKLDEKLKWIVPAVVLLTIVITSSYLGENKQTGTERNKIQGEIKAASYKDNERFNEVLTAFDKTHEEINIVVSDDSLTNEQLLEKINNVCLPGWEKTAQSMKSTSSFDISPEAHAKADKLLQYISLRTKEADIIKQMLQENKTDELMPQLNEVRTKAYSLFDEIIKQ